jgi:hypothetical protein
VNAVATDQETPKAAGHDRTRQDKTQKSREEKIAQQRNARLCPV